MRFLRLSWGIILLSSLLLLILHPDMRWLVAMQLRLLYSSKDAYVILKHYLSGRSPEPAWFRERLDEVVQQHAQNYTIQLAWLVEKSRPTEVQLRPLLARFGNRPALLAHILRYDALARVRIRRPEEWAFTQPSQPVPGGYPTFPEPEHFASYDQIAAEGERLDPDNAYFSIMRAAGLFAVKRDDEAIAALVRASRKARWDDYAHEEAEARLLLWTTAFGRQPAISRYLNADVVLEGHFATVRAVARMVRYLAAQRERSGDQHGAAQLRMVVLRCARLMRVHSRSSIGAVVASAVVGTVISSPDVPRRQNETPEQYTKRTREHFLNVLRQLGRKEDAVWAQREFAAIDTASRILIEGFAPQRLLAMPLRLVRAWTINLLILALGLGTLVLWGVAALATRPRLYTSIIPYFLVLWALAVIGTAAILSPWADFPAQTTAILKFLWEASGDQPSFIAVPPIVLRVATAVITVFLLLMIVIAIMVIELLRGREPKAALLHGLRASGGTVAGLLVLLYLVSVRWTLYLETTWAQELVEMRQQPGRYCAKQLGESWPP
jgi:hypothetical protein